MKIKLFTALIGMFLMMTAKIFAGQTVDLRSTMKLEGI